MRIQSLRASQRSPPSPGRLKFQAQKNRHLGGLLVSSPDKIPKALPGAYLPFGITLISGLAVRITWLRRAELRCT